MAFPVVGSTSMVIKFKILRRPKVIREELTLGFSLSATPGKHDGVQERVQQLLSIWQCSLFPDEITHVSEDDQARYGEQRQDR